MKVLPSIFTPSIFHGVRSPSRRYLSGSIRELPDSLMPAWYSLVSAIADESFKSKKFDDAIRNYQAALKINPSDEVTLLKLGNIYKAQNDMEKAVDFYKKAIFVNPSYADGWFNLGLAYANDNDIAGSKECFNRVISIDSKYAYAYFALALAFETENNKEEAVKNYQKFLEYNTDETQVAPVLDKIKKLS